MNKLLLLALFLNYSVFEQTENIVGEYEFRIEVTNALIIDKLSLYSDGTFTFHEYEKIEKRLIPKGNKYAKGTWKAEKNLITFASSESDFDDKYTLDFNNTKARFITKSPRDTSDRDIKTSIQFYESETPWISKRTLIKMN